MVTTNAPWPTQPANSNECPFDTADTPQMTPPPQAVPPSAPEEAAPPTAAVSVPAKIKALKPTNIARITKHIDAHREALVARANGGPGFCVRSLFTPEAAAGLTQEGEQFELQMMDGFAAEIKEMLVKNYHPEEVVSIILGAAIGVLMDFSE